MTDSIKNVFFDTDCLSSFLKIGREDVFLKVIKGEIVIADSVYCELLMHDKLAKKIDELLIENKRIKRMSIYIDDNVGMRYYKEMTNPKIASIVIGDGEAEAIALCKINKGVLASNNLKDILLYVKKYGIDHITTADILYEAYKLNIINEIESNEIWKNMIEKRIVMPFDSFTEYIETLPAHMN